RLDAQGPGHRAGGSESPRAGAADHGAGGWLLRRSAGDGRRAARHQRAYPPLAGCGRVTGGFMRGRWGAEIFGHAKAQRRKGVAPCGEAALKNGSHEDTKMVRQTQASCTPSSCLRVKLFAASPQTRHLGAFAPLRETILVLFSASPR